MASPFPFALALVAFLLTSCGHRHKNEEKDPAPDPRLADLRLKLERKKQDALALREPTTGWLSHNDCDAMLWTGKYAAVTGVVGVNIAAAEYPDEPGRFSRRPPPGACDGPGGSASSWSRDMGMGLMAYAWRTGDLPLLNRHEVYGRTHDWRMGEPLADGRSVYTPSMAGKLYEIIYALGGADNVNRYWPDLYPTGLTDYQAHLEVMSIWLRGEIEESLRLKGAANPTKPEVDDSSTTKAATLLDVTDKALAVLKEQAARDPRDPLFQAVYGIYTGDMGPALTACLAADDYAGSYARCDDGVTCQLAGWLFACDLVSRRFP